MNFENMLVLPDLKIFLDHSVHDSLIRHSGELPQWYSEQNSPGGEDYDRWKWKKCFNDALLSNDEANMDG